jgi:SAM-dependent methyltransferase
MTTPKSAQARAAATYNAAADRFDDPANSFWERFGRRTIERLRPEAGTRILDVCCGSGTSALAAAEIVGRRASFSGSTSQRTCSNWREERRAAFATPNFGAATCSNCSLGDEIRCRRLRIRHFLRPRHGAAAQALWRAVGPVESSP